jgi:hypothetical protein
MLEYLTPQNENGVSVLTIVGQQDSWAVSTPVAMPHKAANEQIVIALTNDEFRRNPRINTTDNIGKGG